MVEVRGIGRERGDNAKLGGKGEGLKDERVV